MRPVCDFNRYAGITEEVKEMNKLIVKTEGLKKYYRLGKNTVKALDGVDFSVKEKEFVAIIGRSGSGRARCFI